MSDVIENGALRGAKLGDVFDRVVCLDWYDGPVAGALRCRDDSREYRFDMVDNAAVLDYRVFALVPVPTGAIDRFVDMIIGHGHEPPEWPIWFPVWRFPTEADRAAADAAAEDLCRSSVPTDGAFCWDVGHDRLLAYRQLGSPDPLPGDWFEWLALRRPGKRIDMQTGEE